MKRKMISTLAGLLTLLLTVSSCTFSDSQWEYSVSSYTVSTSPASSQESTPAESTPASSSASVSSAAASEAAETPASSSAAEAAAEPLEPLDIVGAFPQFQAQDFAGNAVDETIFSNEAVTVVNFWFNGCAPCVEELPVLQQLSKDLSDMGGQLIGVNVEAGKTPELLAQAKEILAKQGADYTNLCYSAESGMNEYTGNLMAFPTTIVLDRKGNLIGEALMGAVDKPERMEELMARVELTIAHDAQA